MILSVLIPSVPARREMALALFDKIAKQAQGLSVEVLLLLDNKQRTIGAKRDALLRIAKGDYVAFVDDDDDVVTDYVYRILEGNLLVRHSDVIVFDSVCRLNNYEGCTVRHSLDYENEQYNPAGFKRKPWHIHAWRREFVLPYSFPDVNYGEDWGWVSQFIERAKTQVKIDLPLYFYRFDSNISEAAN